METNRDHIAQLLIGYLKNSMSKKEEEEFETWLDEDIRNRALLEEFKRAKDLGQRLNLLASLDEHAAWDRLQQRLHSSERKSWWRTPYFRWATFVAAASISLFLTFIWIWRQDGDSPLVVLAGKEQEVTDVPPASNGAQLILADGKSILLDTVAVVRDENGVRLVHDGDEMRYTSDIASPQRHLTFNTLIVPKASFFRIVLDDGTKVWVNAMSKLKFPVAFSSVERRVFLEGEAYFEVAEDCKKPFIVEVDDGRSVKVLGTNFNINTYHGRMYTTLERGKVEVLSGGQKKVLEPGQQAYVVKDRIDIRRADMKRNLAWKNNEFYFKDDNIVQIAHQLSLWYDLDVRFGAQVSTTKTYSGSIGRDVNLSEVLDLLTYATKLSFKLEGRKLTISETKRNSL